jgi:hypothetical protein
VNDHRPAGAKGQSRPGRLGFVVAACLASAALVTPIAIGATGNPLDEGVRNPRVGNASSETLIIARTRANVYGTRQSNVGAGGAAIYGCRTTADFTALANTELSTPCLRVNNLRNGLIHSFRFGAGGVGGVYQAGATDENDPTARPFITNATGVATGLNADRVDGMHLDEIIAAGRASLVGPTGPKGDAGAGGDQGPRGPAGRGSKWFTGANAPSGDFLDTQVGDFYLDSGGVGAGDVYEKTAAGTWTLRGNIEGPRPAPDPAQIDAAVATYCSQSGHCGTP